MKNISIKKLHQLLGELYWKAHGDGMVAANFGTDFGLAEVSIADSTVKFFPSHRAAYVLQKLSTPPNPASSGRAQRASSSGKQSKAKVHSVRARR